MISANIIIGATLGGLIPAFIWLLFWQSEDSARPEPRGVLIRTFILGMLAVVLVLPFQNFVKLAFPEVGLMSFFLWAALEELFKFGAAYFGGISSIEDDEPLDQLIYMITAALGFAAVENILFILSPLIQHDILARQDIIMSIVTGNLRFIGASLLHTVSSATVGVAMALSFYKTRGKRIVSLILGLILAAVFHTIFNLFVVNQNSSNTFITFGMVWVGVTLLLWFFQVVKGIKILPRKS